MMKSSIQFEGIEFGWSITYFQESHFLKCTHLWDTSQYSIRANLCECKSHIQIRLILLLNLHVDQLR